MLTMIALALPSLVPAYCIPLTFFYHTMNVIVDFLEDLLPDFICDFVRVMLNSLVFNWLVFFALFLVVLLVERPSYRKDKQENVEFWNKLEQEK